jgi:hypothetical protein
MSLNNSKFFAGLVMIMLNIGSKYVTIKLSKTQEEYMKHAIARQLLIFSIIWMGTRDIYISLGLTAVFIVLTQYLFNEESSFCILPAHMRVIKSSMDVNDDDEISDAEIHRAVKILEKAKQNERKRNQLEMLNMFK